MRPAVAAKRDRTEVRASEFLHVLDEYPSVRTLSLDCFDTLLFRQTSAPTDVFFDLQHTEPFHRLGFNAKLRMSAEGIARQLQAVRTGSIEVRLADIYRAGFPDLDEQELRELAEAELAAEIRACYPLPQTVELIRLAKARGLRVIIVSDTYLEEKQLRRLLDATLPQGTLDKIDRIFCSSAYGKSKVNGLFAHVLQKQKASSTSILHIGDNFAADARAPRAAGLEALHFVHYEQQIEQMLRFQTAACNVLCPAVRASMGAPSPFRGVLAAHGGARRAPEDVLGYAGAGPILYAFARFILDELEQLRAQGKKPRPLFLMRDAFLPQEVCKAVAGHDVGFPVAISRFASYAASFRSAKDVERYLGAFAGSARFDTMVKQLLLPEEMGKSIALTAKAHANPVTEFARLIRRAEVLEVIFDRSKAYRTRLFRYLRTTAGVEPGDTLVFVDLGYEGTAQRLLEPVLRDELGVELVGRYLIVSRTPGWERARKGLLDPSWCDDRVIATLVPHVAVLENLCTADDATVVGYEEDGTPVRGEKVLPAEQYARIRPLQASVVAFAKDAEAFFRDAGKSPDPETMRTTALAAIGRLIFYPTEAEISYLEGFRLDMNLGTSDALKLFDRELGLQGLRRRGLFFMEQNQRTMRTNYPVELRSAGIELATTLLTVNRYGVALSPSDASLRREPMTVLIVRGHDATTANLEAHATHDGYFALLAPVGGCDLNLGVLFGRYAWVQIESIDLIKATSLHGNDESEQTEDARSCAKFDAMVERAPGLYECLSDAAFVMIEPRTRFAEANTFVCRIVFRPIALRTAK
ncbi:MAG TPA: HAD family hydrolase [Polyangiaceae bacterium]|nr:HAD family hydrolase [Polyangiaceae bacterium]